MKHLFIINPTAGKGDGMSFIPAIHNYFSDNEDEYHIEITKNPGHAKDIAQLYSQKGIYRIYTIGGDGTLNEALNGMAGTQSMLGVLPAGSGNDFIKSIYKSRDYDDILSRTISGKAKPVDCGIINGRYFINIMSVGLDAEVAYYAAKVNKKIPMPGKLSYFCGIVIALFKSKLKFPLKIVINDSDVFESEVILAACTNGKYYGGGFIPVPYTDYSDGVLDLCLVDARNIFSILYMLPKYMKGKHVGMKGFHFKKLQKMFLTSDHEMKINIEGEFIFAKTAELEIRKKFINFIIPNE